MENLKDRNQQANENMVEYGIHILHYPPQSFNPGGATVAFRPKHHSRMFEISISYCSEKDQFNKKIGKILAVERMVEGEAIDMRLPKNAMGGSNRRQNKLDSIKEFLREIEF